MSTLESSKVHHVSIQYYSLILVHVLKATKKKVLDRNGKVLGCGGLCCFSLLPFVCVGDYGRSPVKRLAAYGYIFFSTHSLLTWVTPPASKGELM